MYFQVYIYSSTASIILSNNSFQEHVQCTQVHVTQVKVFKYMHSKLSICTSVLLLVYMPSTYTRDCRFSTRAQNILSIFFLSKLITGKV